MISSLFWYLAKKIIIKYKLIMSGSTLEKSANAMTNLPYFDFNLAIEDYGLDFQEFSADGFSAFLEETYLDNFIQLRKNFINKDFSKVRFYAHKFKGVFQ